MSGESSGTVDIDLSYHPGNAEVSTRDEGWTYSYKITNGTFTINLGYFASDITTYRKLTHNLPHKSAIKSIKYNDGSTTISMLNKSEFHVYYWIGDTGYTTPLIVQLDEKNCYEYKGSQWTKDSVASVNLGKGLDIQNCSMNKAHQIDISKKGSDHSCNSSFCNQKFEITSDETNKTDYQYTKYTFTPQTPENPSFLYFTNKYIEQTGFSYQKDINQVNTYWKTDAEVSLPSLIHYASEGKNIWHKKSKETNIWEEISQNVNSSVTENDAAVIKRLINNTYLPKITIDVSQTNTPLSTYTDTNSQETIRVSEQEGDPKGYEHFIHRPNDNIYFKLGTVKHKSATLKGITSDEPLESVTAYYYGSNPSDEKKLLLVSLLRKNGDKKNVYYSRPLVSGGSWTREEHDDQLRQDQLQNILDALKKAHFPESPTTTIVGSSLGSGLGGAGLGGLAVWKGPALIARLITRM